MLILARCGRGLLGQARAIAESLSLGLDYFCQSDTHRGYAFFERDRIMSEFDRRKREVGMAPPGTREYYRNAAHILGANPNHGDAQQKLQDLTRSSDPVTRAIARDSLRGGDSSDRDDD
jgi:hypothetical protein